MSLRSLTSISLSLQRFEDDSEVGVGDLGELLGEQIRVAAYAGLSPAASA